MRAIALAIIIASITGNYAIRKKEMKDIPTVTQIFIFAQLITFYALLALGL